MIPVTKPFLPDKSKFDQHLKGIWKRNWLTNNGPLLNEFELRLKDHLRVKHLAVTGNGTIALQMAIKALELSGEIITTPFSYVATTSSLVWEGCKAEFVDIDPKTLNIDPEKIEKAITAKTSAILATHCFGNSCDIAAIKSIAQKHGLRVIYDGAHCFGTTYDGRSVFEFGDISTVSFHATKLIHSIEGGAVFTSDPDLLKKLAFMRNFGHAGPTEFFGLGINGKNSEIHAAMGLCVLDHVDEILEKRKMLHSNYLEVLNEMDFEIPLIQENCEPNFSYFPIIFKSQKEALLIKEALEKAEIYPRRYFYPPLNTLNYVEPGGTPCADDIASRILCLPLYHDMEKEEQELIARIMIRTQKYAE